VVIIYKKKISTIVISILLIGTICQIETLNGKNIDGQTKDLPTPPVTHLFPYRQVLKPNDEGSHQSERFITQEWWYFNAFLNGPDSELRNWSLMISFNQMGVADMFFMTLYDDKNNSYGGSAVHLSGKIQSGGPGVKVEYRNSFATGTYPKWHVYTEDANLDERNITANLTYKANSLPLWLLFNTGHNLKLSPAGHYCMLNCEVTGEIKIDETVYYVSGVGYHEHSWFKILSNEQKQIDIKQIGQEQFGYQDSIDAWDWFCIHFENGWDMFAGKFFQGSPFAKFMPGNLWITPDGENITECSFFSFEYLETVESSLPPIEIPTKIRIRAIFFNTLITSPLEGLVRLDITIKTKNIHEFIWGYPPQYGMWEGPCEISGTIKWKGNTVKLNGWSIMEFTRKTP